MLVNLLLPVSPRVVDRKLFDTIVEKFMYSVGSYVLQDSTLKERP